MTVERYQLIRSICLTSRLSLVEGAAPLRMCMTSRLEMRLYSANLISSLRGAARLAATAAVAVSSGVGLVGAAAAAASGSAFLSPLPSAAAVAAAAAAVVAAAASGRSLSFFCEFAEHLVLLF